MFRPAARGIDGAVGMDGGFVDQDDVGSYGGLNAFFNFDQLTVLHHDIIPWFGVMGAGAILGVQAKAEEEG